MQANLTKAALSAARLQDWPALARLIELSRAADYLYQWRLDDHRLAEAYGRTYAELFGGQALADRLVHDGRCTFPARPGLVLCQLCDELGVSTPWTEYLHAHDVQRKNDNSSYDPDSDRAIDSARLAGKMRLKGRKGSIIDCIQLLRREAHATLHPADIAFTLGGMYGKDSLLEAINGLPPGMARAWAHHALMQLADNPAEARAHAETSIREKLPRSGWRGCLSFGAEPVLFSKDPAVLPPLTERVLSDRVHLEDDILEDWLIEIELAAADGDEVALLHAEASIPPDSWFRRWLRFCVTRVHPEFTTDQIVSSLHDLSRDVKVFEGDPRVCDLYSLHGEIQRSFRQALAGLDDARWQDALMVLSRISAETSTWLQRSRSGPLPVDALLEIVVATANSEVKRFAASSFAAQLLSPEHQGAELYDTHAQDSLLLARIHLAAGQRAAAGEAGLKHVGISPRMDGARTSLYTSFWILSRPWPLVTSLRPGGVFMRSSMSSKACWCTPTAKRLDTQSISG